MSRKNQSEVHFREIQHFRQTRLVAIAVLIILVLFILLGLMILEQLFFGGPAGGNALSHRAPALIGSVVCLLGIGIVYFVAYVMRLETEVQEDALSIRFHPVMSDTIRFDDIERVEVRTYRPIREYGGWGIRGGLGKSGGVYNVSGNRGVQLELANGKRLLIGSQRPEELAKAIAVQMERSEVTLRLR